MKKIFNWSLLVFVFSIPLSQYLNVRILVLLLIFSLFLGYSKEILLRVARQNWDLLFYISVLVAGIFYSEDQTQALKVLETSFSVLALPFVFGVSLKGEDSSNKYIFAFSLAVLMTSAILIITATIQYIETSNEDLFLYYQLTELVGLQPTYLAYYVIFVTTSMTFAAYYNTIKIPIALFTIILFFLFVILLLTGGKTAFIGMILSLSFFALKFLLDIRSLKKIYVVSSVSLILAAFMYISTSEYFHEILSKRTDYWERSILWKSAIEANPNALLGVGTGDYKDVLNKYYETRGMKQYANGSFNSHNQFIQLYFSNGILGLVALIVIIGRPLYLAFKVQNSLGILIIFPFIIYGMTEVFLGRYQGVVFFILCHQIVISQYYSTRPEFILNRV